MLGANPKTHLESKKKKKFYLSMIYFSGCFGDYYTYYAGMCALADDLGEDRAMVVSYERLRADFRAEVERLAASVHSR